MTGEQKTLFPKPEMIVLRDLDRAEVEPLAFKILQAIEPMCEKVQIAGSIRRRKGGVNDIDIVVQPKQSFTTVTGDFWLTIKRSVIIEFDAIAEKQGDKLATFYVPFASRQGQGHVQVDLYRATESTWGILLLVRTGSKEHNVHLCNLALAKGMRLLYSQGLVDKEGKVIAGKTEEEVFEALGLPFILPQDREVKQVAVEGGCSS
jgi:DNA polymerase (family 10)